MDEDLIDQSDLSIARQSVLPGAGFFYPDSLDERREEREIAQALANATTVVVADPDADGLACTALIREFYGHPPEELIEDIDQRLEDLASDSESRETDDEEDAGEMAAIQPGEVPVTEAVDGEDPGADATEEVTDDGSRVGLVPTGPSDVAEALERVAAYAEGGADVFVCDLCPDEFETVREELEAVLEVADRVRWFDHHQWENEVARKVREAGVDLVIGESDEECTADVTLRSLSYDFPAHLSELATVTRDHDLWICEDERSDDLADLAYWLDADVYVALVQTYGPDLPDSAAEYLASRRERKQALIDRAVQRADLRTVGEWTVGVTYGRCSQNEVAERLREQGADAAVVVKPAGSASIRGSESFERCHEVARQVQGGGHPKAAGCKPDVYDDMLDYAHHWTTRGSVAKQAILSAFRSLEPEERD